MGEYLFEKDTDYKATLERHIHELVEGAKVTARVDRIEAVDALTSAYVAQTGERPSNGALYRLSNVILTEELTDPHPDKVTREDYPIMSEGQLEHRARRERAWPHWHINGDYVVGRRKTSHTDANGVSRVSMQRIQKRF